MLGTAGFMLRGALLGAADSVMTAPAVRWTWTGLGDERFTGALRDFRPTDPEAVREMMGGRYLLASKLIDTEGASPFEVDTAHADWVRKLHGFSWLRHFSSVRDPGARSFARTLVLDWIAHEGQFERESWTPALTAVRVMNWLRQFEVLLEGASPEQAKAIQGSLRTQVQSLKLRLALAPDPVDTLMAAIALAAAALCEVEDRSGPEPHLARLNAILTDQIDADGMHLSRNPAIQIELLVELISLRGSLAGVTSDAGIALAAHLERMHEALDALTLGTGLPSYVNGCGQVAQDTLVAVQAHGTRRRRQGVIAGYGVLREGEAVVIADSGRVPPPAYAGKAHAGALGFEFSHGTELVVGNCGPAPSDMAENRDLFREGIAHSAPTIEDVSANPIPTRGPFKGRLIEAGAPARIEADPQDNMLILTNSGYVDPFGVLIERRLTLMGGGATLVGQDRLIGAGTARARGEVAARFHLSPGTIVQRASVALVRLILPSGTVWTFLWEGAELEEDDSVRQSAYVGFQRTRQLVLTAPAEPGAEMAWIFTREQG